MKRQPTPPPTHPTPHGKNILPAINKLLLKQSKDDSILLAQMAIILCIQGDVYAHHGKI
jgi:hypothetical protein